jgi:hypothetical protein
MRKHLYCYFSRYGKIIILKFYKNAAIIQSSAVENSPFKASMKSALQISVESIARVRPSGG